MGYTVLILGLVLIVTAWGCYQFPNLINPYGSLPPERKALVNIEGLKKAIAIVFGVTGLLLVVTATLLMLKVIDDDVSGTVLVVLVLAMMVPLFIAMRVYNGFGRYQSGQSAASASTPKAAWAIRVQKGSWVLTGIVLVAVAILLVLSFRAPQITVGEETIKISGMYGREIPVSEVVSVTLLDEMPPISQRVNGSDVGKQLKGYFKFGNGDKGLLFIYKEAPYIQLRTTDHLYYLNFSDKEKTEELFETLKKLAP